MFGRDPGEWRRDGPAGFCSSGDDPLKGKRLEPF